MEFLEPLQLRNEYFEPIEQEIKNLFDNVLFAPLAAIFKEFRVSLEIRNDNDPIAEAIASGKVYTEDNLFYGSFNSKLSKRFKQLGAKFNKLRNAWVLNGAVPAAIQMAIAQRASKVDTLVNSVLHTLNSVDVKRMTENTAFPARYFKTTEQINRDFERTVQKISIVPKFTPEQAAMISKNYATNLELYIQKWTADAILALRQQVKARVYKGGRAEGLARIIEATYQVSRDKAKFLARQETSLLMAQMREQRYKGIGVRRYKWSGVMDQREREDHKLLNGQIFSFDDPPITNRQTGARNNPGQDYGCRCVVIAIVEGYNDET